MQVEKKVMTLIEDRNIRKLWRWFILAVVVSVKLLTCQGNRDNPVDIVVTDGGAENIVKLRVDGMDVKQTKLISSITPFGIVYDDVENRLYWIELWPNRIRSSDVDGRNVRLVTDLPSGWPQSLAVGLVSRKLFYTDWGRNVITSMDITGENVNTILNKTQVDEPWSITVHERKGIIIWSDKKTGYKISSSNFDGSDIKMIVSLTAVAYGLTVDGKISVVYDVLYWSEYLSGRISSVFLDGTNRRVLYHHDSKRLYDIVLLGNTLYFTASGEGVHRMLINGSNEEEIQSTPEFIYPTGLVVLASKTLEKTDWSRTTLGLSITVGILLLVVLSGVLITCYRRCTKVPVYDVPITNIHSDGTPHYQDLILDYETPQQVQDYLTPVLPQVLEDGAGGGYSADQTVPETEDTEYETIQPTEE